MKKVPYDSIAQEYYDVAHKTSRNFDQTALVALQDLRFRIPTNGLILDIGAGKGRGTEFLGVESKRIIQLDSSHAMLEIQPREDCLLRVWDKAEKLPFLDSEFGCVTSFLCDPFLGLNVFSEVYRVLATGGLFIATTPSREWGVALREDLNLDLGITRFVNRKGDQVRVPSVLASTSSLSEMLQKVGFKKSSIQIREHTLPLGVSPISNDIVIPAQKLGKNIHDLVILYSIVAEK